MKVVVEIIFLNFFIVVVFGACPETAIEYQNDCYFFVKSAQTFSDAEVACNKINGHLASIHDAFANDFIANQSITALPGATDFWIGINSLMEPLQWKWSDNSTTDFLDWPHSPKRKPLQCTSMIAGNGIWNPGDCLQYKFYVCKATIQDIANYHTAPTSPCPNGWYYFAPTHSCYGTGYYGSNGDTFTWADAENYCQGLNSHLISFHSQGELDFASIIVQASDGLFSWSGLHYVDSSWQWSDGSPDDYLPWIGEPDFLRGMCAYWLSDEKMLNNDDRSNSESFTAMCKKSATLF